MYIVFDKIKNKPLKTKKMDTKTINSIIALIKGMELDNENLMILSRDYAEVVPIQEVIVELGIKSKLPKEDLFTICEGVKYQWSIVKNAVQALDDENDVIMLLGKASFHPQLCAATIEMGKIKTPKELISIAKATGFHVAVVEAITKKQK